MFIDDLLTRGFGIGGWSLGVQGQDENEDERNGTHIAVHT